jgi:hypothetical protein
MTNDTRASDDAPGRRAMARDAGVSISLAEVQPGMVLAEAAHDAQGRLLMPPGTTLTTRHQRQLRHWGVEVVVVLASSAPNRHATPPASALPPIGELLHLDERDPFMRELAQMARDRFARHQRRAARPKEGSRV